MADKTYPKNIMVTSPEKGERVGVMGDNYRIVVSGKDTDGQYAIIDMIVPPGGGPTPHSHPDIHETFFVTEGELLYKTELGHSIVNVGGFVDIPKGGAVHCFKNVSERNARVICTVTPAGLEEFFKELGASVQAEEFLPVPELTPEFVKHLENLNKKYGQISFAPDYLD
ncbi:cupin domain-containing protein [Sphingobacterium detergens]|uniref:Quercetin dioxygenase-like cupin family protein n=1 Tax=Sphingobacterium detergens TaxID=1145106 RepID=A0A420ARP5_SPHD1|nr:cupin domain-containing protein [Sphingobacterium detergens]RKE47090.1 quercetin dioxygenase-like cupin family protein [Sphingobacterium detergens]